MYARSRTRNTATSALNTLIGFRKRGTTDDGFGNQVPGSFYTTQFLSYAHFRPLSVGAGNEIYTQDMLQGRFNFLVTVRYRPELDNIATSWEVAEVRNAINPQWSYGTGLWPTEAEWLTRTNASAVAKTLKFYKNYNIKSLPFDPDNSGRGQFREFVVQMGSPS